MRTRLLACWGTLLLVGLVVVGCKGFFTSQSTTPGTTGFVYVLNSAQGAGNIGSISGYQANASTGVLSPLVNSPFGTGSQLNTPTSMSADALGKFVYVSSAAGAAGGGPGVAGFVISSNTNTLGQLSSTTQGVQATQATPAAIAVTPSAGAVYAVESGAGGPQVEGFTINTSTGVLTAQAGSPYSLVPPETSTVSPTSVTVASSGAFLFVGVNNGDIVSVPIKGDGTLNIAAAVKTAALAGVTNVAALAADSSVLYAVDGTQYVSTYIINLSTGALTAVAKYAAGSAPISVGVVSVNGINGTPTFVYTVNQGSNNVSAFIIGNSGTLSALANSPFSLSITTPVALAVDPSQAFLYVVGKGSNSVLSFVIVNGQLSAPATSNPPTGTAPTAVVAVP